MLIDLSRRYPLVVAAVVLGMLIIVAASFVLSEGSLVWVGLFVGIAIGGVIVASQRQMQAKGVARTKAARRRARKRR